MKYALNAERILELSAESKKAVKATYVDNLEKG